MDDQKRASSKQIILQANMSEELLSTYSQRERHRSRSLGLLETMYHTYNCREVDVSPMYFELSCKYQVERSHVNEALYRLVEEFPALRLTIVQTGRYAYKFVEKRNLPVSFSEKYFTSASEVLDHECHHRFDFSRGPLWTFTWLKDINNKPNKSGLPYCFNFLFTFHHAISDFRSSRLVVHSFIRNIVHSQGVLPVTLPTERKLYPSIENVIPLDLIRKELKLKQRTQWSRQALDMYNDTFSAEIAALQKENPSTNMRSVLLADTYTAKFFQQCKTQQVKVTSAILAAMAVSFTNLVRKRIPENFTSFTVPTEIVVDLRHYILGKKMEESFSSVGAIHMPFLIEISLIENITSSHYYWSLARDCQSKLNKLMADGEPMKVLLRDVPQEIRGPPEKGKSPFVLTVTNLGSLEDITPAECLNEVRLNCFLPWSNVSTDDMPIFYTGIHTLNNSMNIVTGSCKNYTSQQTMNAFTATMLKILQNCSKL